MGSSLVELKAERLVVWSVALLEFRSAELKEYQSVVKMVVKMADTTVVHLADS